MQKCRASSSNSSSKRVLRALAALEAGIQEVVVVVVVVQEAAGALAAAAVVRLVAAPQGAGAGVGAGPHPLQARTGPRTALAARLPRTMVLMPMATFTLWGSCGRKWRKVSPAGVAWQRAKLGHPPVQLRHMCLQSGWGAVHHRVECSSRHLYC
jgi:hypothetical protein